MVIVELKVKIIFDNTSTRSFHTTYKLLCDEIEDYFDTDEYGYGQWLNEKIYNVAKKCENDSKFDDLIIASGEGFQFFKHVVNYYTKKKISDYEKIDTIKITAKKVLIIGGDNEWT